jgi:hypothetical protein
MRADFFRFGNEVVKGESAIAVCYNKLRWHFFHPC